ncbi:MAG: 1-deoxy-D-xylulose-5-phosphate reductoisomerase [Leptospirillum sp.]|jgi:1-deoxy-D-xylulose-5-phosphate reductoisomerase
MRRTSLSVLGSTGSIGRSALDIVLKHPDRFHVLGMAAGKNLEVTLEQARLFKPEILSVSEEVYSSCKESLFGSGIKVLSGEEGAVAVAAYPGAEVLLSAIVGDAGLPPTWEGILPGRTIALANKETLVAGGSAVMGRIREKGARLVPVDSEHSAIYQAMKGHDWTSVRRVILTASGGPMFGKTKAEMAHVTVEEALNHPTWRMGPKITIDSATLMNKGLEVIEARWLFDLPSEKIEVVVHRQSIIHSLVELVDGSVLAQMGVPDMRGPISYAISGDERLVLDVKSLDLVLLGQMTFHHPDHDAFPSIRHAYRALERGGQSCLWLNAANEVAVAHFLEGKIPFSLIARIQGEVLEQAPVFEARTLDEIIKSGKAARYKAQELAETYAGTEEIPGNLNHNGQMAAPVPGGARRI